MGKDWTGTARSAIVTNGARNFTSTEREKHDYYATHPDAVKSLLSVENFNHNIWEPCCGEGHISKELISRGYLVKSTDLIDREFGTSGIDFLQCTEPFDGDIITNPPYKYATDCVYKALELIPVGNRVAMFLKLTFLESKKRYDLFKSNPPKYVYVFVNRQLCAMNGDFSVEQSAIAYAWYIWEKGFSGEPVIRWLSQETDVSSNQISLF